MVETMYDKRLDTVFAVARLGSFNKAARQLGYSVPAVIRQVNGFESQTGVTVFERTNKGVVLTSAGRMLVEDAQDIVRKCNLTIRRARRSQRQSDELVRVGVSLYRSGQYVLELIKNVYLSGADLKVHFVPVADTYESYIHTVENFGEEIDVLTSTWLPEGDERNCNRVVLWDTPLSLYVSLDDELARYDTVDVSRLEGRHIYVPCYGNSFIDSARAEIKEKVPSAKFVEFPQYELEMFDECVMHRGVLLGSDIWREIHPLMKMVGVNWDKTIPYCLYYEKYPRRAVEKFVDCVTGLSGSEGRPSRRFGTADATSE